MTWASRAVASTLAALILVASTLGTLTPAAGTASAASATTGPAAQQLADRYAPVVAMQSHDGVCGDPGEPYVPMTVDAMLDNPEIALRQVGNGDPVIKWAPTAADLYGRGEGVYLDFPGDSLQPGCIFASDSARYTPLSRAAVYAHVAQQSDRPGYLAVQYWLYWYYNDWNDVHESDWEFVQVLFRASSVDEALTKAPSSVGYAQHTGGEVSSWTSAKLEREGNHPVIYSSVGSHASYVQQALFLGRGASEGFGCDNTQGPSTRVRPKVVLLPDSASGPEDPFAWLAFQGRWGERQASPNNGPTGPSSKPRWTEPVSWEEGLRPSSFVIPGGSAAAPAIVDTFCSVVGQGSVLFINFMSSPTKVLLGLVLLGLVLAFLLRRTSWRRVGPLPVVARRRAGEIVRASIALYRRQPLSFAALGSLAIPVALLAVLISAVVEHLPFIGPAVTVADSGGPGGKVVTSSIVATALWPLTVVLVSAAVSAMLGAGHRQHGDWWATPLRGPRESLATVWHRTRALGSSFVPAAIVIVVLGLTVVGLPIAAWLTVRWQFLPQVVILEGVTDRRALERSGALVRHRWIHTALISAMVWVIVQGTGALFGLLLLIIVTGLPLWTVSAAVVVCQVALVPLGSIVLTLLYGDAAAEHEEHAATHPPHAVLGASG